MVASQTQDPFVIKDNFGVDVFTIDPSGVITPSQGGGGVAGVFGTEIVVVDNSGNTGGTNDSGGHEGIMSEVTLPTDAPQYRITAVEVLTDFVSNGEFQRICIALADLHGLSYPIADDEETSIGILSGWNANSMLVGDNGSDILEDTVYKIDIVPVILDGGQTFIVIVNECDNGTDIEFVTASSGAIAFDWDLSQTSILDGEDDYTTIQTGRVFDGYPLTDGFEIYLKVYAQPLE
jgi:hypothetical protein